MAEAVRRELERLLQVVFCALGRHGGMDLEALEMALRAAIDQAGAAALGKLLETQAPEPEQRAAACRCGAQALYRERRSKTLLTALGEVELRRPFYLCPHCGQGQFPTDVELDIENQQFSPGVRRMQALAGQQMPFAQGRQQLALLAGLEVTTKSVERSAEAISEDIARCEQPIRPPTRMRSRAPPSSASGSTRKSGAAVGAAQRRKW